MSAPGVGAVSRRMNAALMLLLIASGFCPAQSVSKGDARAAVGPDRTLHLTAVETVTSPTEYVTGFGDMACDQDGNLFLANESHQAPAISKLNPKGELVARFQPTLNPDMKVAPMGEYAIAPDGELYVWVGSATEITRYVLTFKRDGSYKGRIKLDPGFAWVPASIAVFANGSILMTGQEIVRGKNASTTAMMPFTGIFSSDGRLLKRIDMDDQSMNDAMAGHGDSRVKSDAIPTSNRAIAWGRMVGATDGNIYVLRWSSPAIVFAVSPGGEVVRTLTIDPGDPAYMPRELRAVANRLVLEFVEPDKMRHVIRITDLEGNELARFDNLGSDRERWKDIGTFACYTPQPEHFTFIQTTDSGKLQLLTVEGR